MAQFSSYYKSTDRQTPQVKRWTFCKSSSAIMKTRCPCVWVVTTLNIWNPDKLGLPTLDLSKYWKSCGCEVNVVLLSLYSDWATVCTTQESAFHSPSEGDIIYLSVTSSLVWGSHWSSWTICTEVQIGRGVKLTSYLHLMSRFRMVEI
jgi:hypothetical protein